MLEEELSEFIKLGVEEEARRLAACLEATAGGVSDSESDIPAGQPEGKGVVEADAWIEGEGETARPDKTLKRGELSPTQPMARSPYDGELEHLANVLLFATARAYHGEGPSEPTPEEVLKRAMFSLQSAHDRNMARCQPNASALHLNARS